MSTRLESREYVRPELNENVFAYDESADETANPYSPDTVTYIHRAWIASDRLTVPSES